MIVKVSDLADGEIAARACRYNAAALDIEYDDLHYMEPIRLEVEIRRDNATLQVQGELTCTIDQVCARCLKHVEGSKRYSVDLFFDTKDMDEIDATEDVREILLLEHDVRFLCREDCKGLCLQCGADLNSHACSCSKNIGRSDTTFFKEKQNGIRYA